MKYKIYMAIVLLILIVFITPGDIGVYAVYQSTITGSHNIALVNEKTLKLDDAITLKVSGKKVSFSGTLNEFSNASVTLLLYSTDFTYINASFGKTRTSAKGTFSLSASMAGRNPGSYVINLSVICENMAYSIGVSFEYNDGEIVIYDKDRYDGITKLLEAANAVDREAAASPEASDFATLKGRELVESKTNDIIKDLTEDSDKVRAIYQWIAENIAYDYNAYDPGGLEYYSSSSYQYDRAVMGYTDNIEYNPDVVLERRTSICYGYAQLLAAMTRFAGIPSVCVSLNTNMGRHCNNLIYYNKQWNMMDVTWDAVYGYKWNTPFYIGQPNKGYYNAGSYDQSMLTCQFKCYEICQYNASKSYSDSVIDESVVGNKPTELSSGDTTSSDKVKTTSIILHAPYQQIYVGDMMFLYPEMGNTTKADSPFVRYSIQSGSKYASIDPVFGLLKAIKPGKVVVKATTVDSGLSATYSINIIR